MLDIFKQFAVDLDAEVKGVWRDVQGASLLIARAGNANFTKALADAYAANRDAIDAGGDDAEKLSGELMARALAETVLLGWKGLTFKGEALDYSVETAAEILADPIMHEFRDLVLGMARDAEMYRAKEEEEQQKN